LLGYTCSAIDIDKKQLERAQSFCNEYNLKVSLERADMRRPPYPNNTFSFAFSFNTNLSYEEGGHLQVH
jgi:tRNA G10  N-methylase Trm11